MCAITMRNVHLVILLVTLREICFQDNIASKDLVEEKKKYLKTKDDQVTKMKETFRDGIFQK
jgi:hypothetical protein